MCYIGSNLPIRLQSQPGTGREGHGKEEEGRWLSTKHCSAEMLGMVTNSGPQTSGVVLGAHSHLPSSPIHVHIMAHPILSAWTDWGQGSGIVGRGGNTEMGEGSSCRKANL